MEKHEIKTLIEEVVAGNKTADDAVNVLLLEMGRGGRIFIVDDNLSALDGPLAELGYTVYRAPKGPGGRRLSDDEIKQQIAGRVFITNNGEDFKDDLQRYEYGLIWVATVRDLEILAKEVEAVITRVNFRRNLIQMVKL